MLKNQPKTRAWLRRVSLALPLLLLLASAVPSAPVAVAADGTQVAEAVVLVNSNSAYYADFQHLIQPYLDHFGIPYTVLDVAVTEVTPAIGDYALIIIGHRDIDLTYLDLSVTEQTYILNAVVAGSGLVNFDGHVADSNEVGRYVYVQGIFNFGYHVPGVDYGVTFPPASGDLGTVIPCTNDANQSPVLPTLPAGTAIVTDDGAWTEMLYEPRPVAGLFAGLDEMGNGLPVMHCFASGLPNGQYEVMADLFTGVFGDDMTYYYGYTAANPKEFSVDTVGRSGGEDRFGEYSLGTLTISDGKFDIYFQDADARPVTSAVAGSTALEALYAQDPYVPTAVTPYFGWSSIRLVPVGTPPPTMPWISSNHDPSEWIGTGNMPMSGIGTMTTLGKVVARSKSEPLVIAAPAGQGRGVQWASYEWMSYASKGPMYGLDDLVWRSLVWAARKPFAMQGMLPFLTMRVDDVKGPFDWVGTANTFGIKPWLGLFYQQVDVLSSSQLSSLAASGLATAGVHAKNQNVETTGVFYYAHGTGDLPNAIVDLNFADATAWFTTHNIPISRFLVPQFYELGTNVFDGLGTWGVDFIGTVIDPGTGYGSPWINEGPFRLYENGNSDSGQPLYYADFMNVPAHSEQFFDCLTEIRDDAGYEWYPNNDVAGSIGRGTRQLKRAMDAMALPTLVTHEPFLKPEIISPANLTAILQGITDNLASYSPIEVTMDDACQYVRAMYTSDIDGASFDQATGEMTINLTGNSDMATKLYIFTGQGGAIQEQMADVPEFTGSTQVVVTVAAEPSFSIYLPIAIKQ